MSEELDAGDIILSRRTQIGEDETSGELFGRLASLGAGLLSETVERLERDTAPRTPQEHKDATFAPPLSAALSPIDWTLSPTEIRRHVRALNPWPVAVAQLRGARFKVFAVETGADAPRGEPGEVIQSGERGIEVACGGGSVVITQLQAPGGKRMSAADYLRGHTI
jgi:methionyl-tRNA formyltransferase